MTIPRYHFETTSKTVFRQWDIICEYTTRWQVTICVKFYLAALSLSSQQCPVGRRPAPVLLHCCCVPCWRYQQQPAKRKRSSPRAVYSATEKFHAGKPKPNAHCRQTRTTCTAPVNSSWTFYRMFPSCEFTWHFFRTLITIKKMFNIAKHTAFFFTGICLATNWLTYPFRCSPIATIWQHCT